MNALDLNDYDYDLPEHLIAHEPAASRSQSQLMVVRDAVQRAIGPFTSLVEALGPGDLLVLNDTRVVPCRVQRHRQTGAKVELFVLGPLQGGWEAGPGPVPVHLLARPGRRLRPGERLGDVTLQRRREDGSWDATIEVPHDLLRWASDQGSIPLPPYITRRRRTLGMREVDATDTTAYQTVYAQHPGAVAAPTAGLHFTPELLQQLRAKGVEIGFVTLHVGIGTFKPLDEETASGDALHTEAYHIGESLPGAIAGAQRVIAVGTTSLRALEDQAQRFGERTARSGQYDTRLFIKPGFQFGTVDGLITNFHLPRSSLLVLVSALAGHAVVEAAYRDAIERQMRFYSYGDAMFLTRQT